MEISDPERETLALGITEQRGPFHKLKENAANTERLTGERVGVPEYLAGIYRFLIGSEQRSR